MIQARWALGILVGCHVGAALASSPCRPTELRDLAEQVAASAPAAQTNGPFGSPPLGITIVYDAATWSGENQSGRSAQAMLPVALAQMGNQAEPSPDCGRKYPFADTVFLRHPGLFPRIPDQDRVVFVAAEIARSTPVVLDILQPLLDADRGPVTRYRALLEMINRSMRASDGVTSQTISLWIEEAAALEPDVTPLLASSDVSLLADLDFARAELCLRAGEPPRTCVGYLDAAIEADPWHSAARQLRMELLDHLIRNVVTTRAGECDRLQAQLVVDIRNLLNGLEPKRARIDLGMSLDAAAGPTDPVLLIGAAYAYREGGAGGLAEAALLELEQALSTKHPCNLSLRSALDAIE